MSETTMQLMRPDDVARELGLSRVRVYALIREGEIPSALVGGAIRIPRAAWEAWLAAKTDAALSVGSRRVVH
jgi:excisionase family DNA binding protein